MLLRRAHVPQEEVFVTGREDGVPFSAIPASPREKARIRHEILQKDIDLLRSRLAIVAAQAGAVGKAGAIWVNAGARSQLGTYPWAKFAALTVGSYVVTRALRTLPFGSVAAAAIPLATAALKRRLR